MQNILSCLSRKFEGVESEWQPVLVELLKKILSCDNFGDQNTLLSTRIYFTILSGTLNVDEVKDHLDLFLTKNDSKLFVYDQKFDYLYQKVTRLLMIHGYLLVNRESMYSKEICCRIFQVIQEHCIKYTRHSRFSIKMLSHWLKFTKKTDFWSQDDVDVIEKSLEEIIFSNWDNCIRDIVKINTNDLFPEYLGIMNEKYPGFLEKSWDNCLDCLSWQSATKYTILAEICESMKCLPDLDDTTLTALINTLRKEHLKYTGTKLYLSLLDKMEVSDWRKIIMKILLETAETWDTEDEMTGNDYSALYHLWDLWMKPTLKKYNQQLIKDLWSHFFCKNKTTCQAYLLKLSTDNGLLLPALMDSLKPEDKIKNIEDNIWIKKDDDDVPLAFYDIRESVRQIAFEIFCRGTIFPTSDEKNYSKTEIDYDIIKAYLITNAKASSPKLRKSLFENFEIFFIKIAKLQDENTRKFMKWLITEFVQDCFEIGSCYQRKIIGLRIYEIIMSIAEKNQPENTVAKNFKLLENFNPNMRGFIIHECGLKLAKMCFDTSDDVRDKSCYILAKYYNSKILSQNEKSTFILQAIQPIYSSLKYEQIDGGVKLLNVLLSWNIPESELFEHQRSFDTINNFYLAKLKEQLNEVKEDFCFVVKNSPVYGIIYAIIKKIEYESSENLPISLSNSHHIELLDLLEEATTFFLSILSPNYQDTSSTVDSSSFAEIADSIKEIIKKSKHYERKKGLSDDKIFSKYYDNILYSTWNSLRYISFLAAELSFLATKNFNDDAEKESQVHQRSIDIVVKLLLKCRHKGVIEAAGLALARLMTNKNINPNHFMLHLDKLLSLSTEDKVSLTRRGAGQRIMFHKMMANDTNSHQLLNKALDKLLKSLRNDENILEIVHSNEDHPCARQLHFLQTIIADKSLYVHAVHYMEEISLICLKNIQSTEWSIRNASLQLFGAIVPRLVGQGDDDKLDFATGCSINHFFTHYPVLSAKILDQINQKNNDFNDSIIPVLILLSKMSIGGCDFVDGESDEFIFKIKSSLKSLLNHRIATARNLAAKTYAAFVEPKLILQTLCALNATDNNYCLHGEMSMKIYLKIRANYELISLNENDKKIIDKISDYQSKRMSEVLKYFDNIKEGKSLCYVAETIFLNTLESVDEKREIIHDLISKIDKIDDEKLKCQAGFDEFVKKLEKLDVNCPDLVSDFSEFDKPEETEWNLLEKLATALEDEPDESVIDIVEKAATSEDEIQRRMVISYLTRNLSELKTIDKNDVLNKAKNFLLNFLKSIVSLLTDENPEIREIMSKTLKYLLYQLETNNPNVSKKIIARNSEVCVLDCLRISAHLCTDVKSNYQSEKNYGRLWKKIFPFDTDGLEWFLIYSYEVDNYREYTKIMNFFYSAIRGTQKFKKNIQKIKFMRDDGGVYHDSYTESHYSGGYCSSDDDNPYYVEPNLFSIVFFMELDKFMEYKLNSMFQRIFE